MRRPLAVTAGIVVAVALALIAGLSVSPLRSTATDARFVDSEQADSAGKLATTALPGITFSSCATSVSGMAVKWTYNAPPLPGETTSFTLQLGLNVIGGSSITTTGPDSGGVYTTTAAIASLSIGTYSIHGASALGGWSAAASNHVEGIAASIGVTVWLSCGPATGT